MSKAAKLLVLVFLSVLTSCFNEEQFSDVPNIAFRSLEYRDSPTTDSLILKFDFEDGGANLGFLENSFSSEFDVLVDAEPKVLTADNIDDAIPPVNLASLFLFNVAPTSLEGNTIYLTDSEDTYPAILDDEIYTDRPDTLSLECPNITNQDLSQFETSNIAVYDAIEQPDETTFVEIFRDEINSVVPILPNENYFNIILRFENIINGEAVPTPFAERVGSNECLDRAFSGRIPVFDEEGTSGTITYNITSLLLDIGIGDDPFQIRFYVVDQEGNQSNELVTPALRLTDLIN